MMKKNIDVKINVDKFTSGLNNLGSRSKSDSELAHYHRLLKYINNCVLRELNSLKQQNVLDANQKHISLNEARSRESWINIWESKCNNFPKWKQPRIVVYQGKHYFGIWDKKKEVYARYNSKINDRIKLCEQCSGLWPYWD